MNRRDLIKNVVSTAVLAVIPLSATVANDILTTDKQTIEISHSIKNLKTGEYLVNYTDKISQEEFERLSSILKIKRGTIEESTIEDLGTMYSVIYDFRK